MEREAVPRARAARHFRTRAGFRHQSAGTMTGTRGARCDRTGAGGVTRRLSASRSGKPGLELSLWD